MEDKFKVVDWFFDEDYFKVLKETIMNKKFPWYYQETVNDQHSSDDGDMQYYFEHVLYRNGPNSPFYDLIDPLWDKLNIKSLMRVKANCYPGSQQLITHPAHQDFTFKHTGAIIYLNTNDGKTILKDGTEIDSIENRVLFFDASEFHSSTNCTDKKARFNININYF